MNKIILNTVETFFNEAFSFDLLALNRLYRKQSHDQLVKQILKKILPIITKKIADFLESISVIASDNESDNYYTTILIFDKIQSIIQEHIPDPDEALNTPVFKPSLTHRSSPLLYYMARILHNLKYDDTYIINPLYQLSLNWIDTSEETSMDKLFKDCKKFNFNLSGWDVRNVKTMQQMFSGVEGVDGNKWGISNWKVFNVEDMSYMFNKSYFNGDISNWNVKNVKDMSYMFSGSLFRQPIGRWNVGNVCNFTRMFSDTEYNQDLSGWQLLNANAMQYMFAHNSFENGLNIHIEQWDFSNVKDCLYMLDGDVVKKYKDLLNVNPILKLKWYGLK